VRECDNSRILISSNFLLSISLLIMLDTLLLVPSLHCNTSLHFTKLHFTTLIDTSLPLIYTSLTSHLAYPIYISYRSISPHITKLDTVHFSQPSNNLQNNEPLYCPNMNLNVFLYFHILEIPKSIYKSLASSNVTMSAHTKESQT